MFPYITDRISIFYREAAESLCVSRPHVVKLIDVGVSRLLRLVVRIRVRYFIRHFGFFESFTRSLWSVHHDDHAILARDARAHSIRSMCHHDRHHVSRVEFRAEYRERTDGGATSP